MNYKLKIAIYIFLFSISTYSQAQKINWFVYGNTGFSRTKLIDPVLFSNTEWEHNWIMTWGYTGGLQYKFSSAVFLETGLSFLSIRNSEVIQEDLYYPNSSTGAYFFSGEAIRKSTFGNKYLGLPVSILIKGKRIGFRTGGDVCIC